MKPCVLVSGEAVSWGSWGSRGFCEAWVPSGVLRALFFLCVRVCVCFFCIEFLMRIFFCVWVIDFEFHFEYIFVYSVKFWLRFIVWIMPWTVWSTCTFGHEFKLLWIIKMRFCIVKYNRKININIESKTLSLRSKIVYIMSRLRYFDLLLVIWSMI